jgi:uncharacterized protein YbjT (DUF2867 family)
MMKTYSMKTQNILLAGATGYLGKYICKALVNQSYPTRIIVREGKEVHLDTVYLETVEAEVTRLESLGGVMEGIDTVISTIGITKQKDGLTYMDVDYQGNKNLLEEAKKNGVRKFIYVSSLNGERLTHLKMVEAKEKFVGELKNSALDYCIVRPNGFFSDMSEFLKMAKKGKAELFGDGSYRMNPIHGADLAEVCVNAINASEKNIEVGGPEIFTHNEMVELAFNTIQKPVKISYMPKWIRKTILWSARTFSSSKKYGPLEFFFTVLAMDMLAPTYGEHRLSDFFHEMKTNI